MKTSIFDQEQKNHKTTKDCTLKHSDQKKGYLILKRILDVVLACVGLVFCIIPIGIISLLIKIDSAGPAFYVHHRVGKGGKDIPLLKFRSMHVNADEMIEEFTPEQKEEWESNFKLENDPRITKIGGFLRRSSLDELPQLINILKGELSIVGPRPVVEEELEKYGENKEKFLSVTPGLTGYWQPYVSILRTYWAPMEFSIS